jgi:hypothetical protein
LKLLRGKRIRPVDALGYFCCLLTKISGSSG